MVLLKNLTRVWLNLSCSGICEIKRYDRQNLPYLAVFFGSTSRSIGSQFRFFIARINLDSGCRKAERLPASPDMDHAIVGKSASCLICLWQESSLYLRRKIVPRLTTLNRLPHPYIMLVLAPVIWSTSNVIGKFSVGLIDPIQLTFYRWLVAFGVLSLCFAGQIRNDWWVLKQHKLWIVFWGSSAFCLFNLLLYRAFALGALAVNVAIIHSLIPMITLLLTALLQRRLFHQLQGVGVVLALLSVCWLLTHGHLNQLFGWHPNRANQLILISAFIYAAYSAALYRAPNVHWASLMWGMSLAALLFASPFYIYDLSSRGSLLQVTAPSARQVVQAVFIIAYVGVVIAVISKLFYMVSAIKIGGERAALVMNLLPPFSALFAFIVFADERASWGWLQSTALIGVVIGISLSEWGAWRARQAIA